MSCDLHCVAHKAGVKGGLCHRSLDLSMGLGLGLVHVNLTDATDFNLNGEVVVHIQNRQLCPRASEEWRCTNEIQL